MSVIIGRFELMKEVNTVWMRDLRSNTASHYSVEEVEAALQQLAEKYGA